MQAVSVRTDEGVGYRRGVRALAIAIMALVLLGNRARAADDQIELLFNQRPPIKIRLPDGSVGGTSGSVAAQAFARAGFDVAWTEMPAARQLAQVQANKGPVCGIGFFRTPEREKFALFSVPIDHDAPMVAIGPRKLRLAPEGSLETFLADDTLTVTVKFARSYGSILDERLSHARARIEWVAGNTDSIIAMIRAGRPVATFISVDELTYYINSGEIMPAEIIVRRFQELTKGEDFYLMCSLSFGEERMSRINRAIRELVANRIN